MSASWVPFVAGRFFKARRKEASFASSLLSVLGIALGVATLIVTLGVMNGFQMGFIESILEIGSYHLRIDSRLSESAGICAEVRNIRGVTSALPFYDTQCLAKTEASDYELIRLRALPRDAASLDPSMLRALNMEEGGFDLSGKDSIIIGAELARYLGITIGGRIELSGIGGSVKEGLIPTNKVFLVKGIFRSSYYEYDLSWVFTSFDSAGTLLADYPDPKVTIGVKLMDKYADITTLKEFDSTSALKEIMTISWREFNRSFFGALRMEKTMMMVLIGLIFLVVGVNTYHSMRRTVFEKKEEIGVLRGLGASPNAMIQVFMLDGLIIGVAGASIGLVTGLLLTGNINEVFSLVEKLVNIMQYWLKRASLALSPGSGDSFSLFSSTYFYMTEIPAKVLLPELIFIVFAGWSSAVAAAFVAAKTLVGIKPQEVLRYE